MPRSVTARVYSCRKMLREKLDAGCPIWARPGHHAFVFVARVGKHFNSAATMRASGGIQTAELPCLIISAFRPGANSKLSSCGLNPWSQGSANPRSHRHRLAPRIPELRSQLRETTVNLSTPLNIPLSILEEARHETPRCTLRGIHAGNPPQPPAPPVGCGSADGGSHRAVCRTECPGARRHSHREKPAAQSR
jgi:hypothetical protein